MKPQSHPKPVTAIRGGRASLPSATTTQALYLRIPDDVAHEARCAAVEERLTLSAWITAALRAALRSRVGR